MPNMIRCVTRFDGTLKHVLYGRSKILLPPMQPKGDLLIRAHFGHKRRHSGSGRGSTQVFETDLDQCSDVVAQPARRCGQIRPGIVASGDCRRHEFCLCWPTPGDRSDVHFASPRDLLHAQSVVSGLDQEIADGLEDQAVECGIARSTACPAPLS